MTERLVMINVTREFRDSIKTLKKELTYEEYFNYLLENNSGKKSQRQKTKTTKSGDLLS